MGYSDNTSVQPINQAIGWDEDLQIAALSDGSMSLKSGDVASTMVINLWINGYRFWQQETDRAERRFSPKQTAAWLRAQVAFIHDSLLEVQLTEANAYGQLRANLSSFILDTHGLWVLNMGRNYVGYYDREEDCMKSCFVSKSDVRQDEDDSKKEFCLGEAHTYFHPQLIKLPVDEPRTYFIASETLYSALSPSAMTRVFREYPPQLAIRLLVSQARAFASVDALSLLIVSCGG